MPITLTCPSCGKQCQVKEEYAGMQVRCPNCPGVITVPMLAPSMPVMSSAPVESFPASPGTSPPAPGAPPPMPMSQAGPVFLENINKFLAANGIAGVHRILLFVGVGCMALFLIMVLLPWTPSVSVGGLPGGGTFTAGGALGITLPHGLLYFFGTLAIAFLLVFVVLIGWNSLFSYSLWTSSNWTIFVSLNLLVHLHYAGVGQVLALLVMLGAAGTLGVVALTRVFASK